MNKKNIKSVSFGCRLNALESEKIKNMLLSPDEEIAFVGEQMLFTDYLDLYNVLTKNQFYKTMISSIIKVLPSLHYAYETNEN